MLEFTEKGLFLDGKLVDEKAIYDSAAKIRSDLSKDVVISIDDPKVNADKKLINDNWEHIISKRITKRKKRSTSIV